MSGDSAAAYAQETYNQIYSEMLDHKPTNNGDPTLILIAEEHIDHPVFEGMEPAQQAIYAEISALGAAKNILGSENVILSVEMPEGDLQHVRQIISEGIPESAQSIPSSHTIKFALDNGIDVVASDPLGGSPQHQKYDNSSELRDYAQRKELIETANDNKGAYVVHIGGAMHLSNFQGYKNEEVINANGELSHNPQNTPLRNHYAHQIFINASHLHPIEHGVFESQAKKISDDPFNEFRALVSEFNYVTNKENAIQINPPAYAESIDPHNIVSFVEAAIRQKEFEQSLILEGQGSEYQSPDTTISSHLK